MNRRTFNYAGAALVISLGACSGKDMTGPTPTPPTPPTPTFAVVSSTVTATPIWEVGYAWGLDASEAMTGISISNGAASSAGFDLDVTRGVASARTGAAGQVCVSNSGTAATTGLQLSARVQRQDGETFVDVAGASQALPVSSQIGVGQSLCVPYEIVFEREESATYRTVAQVSITNAQTAAAQASSTPPAASIVFPGAPQSANAGAKVAATVSCAEGFTCSAETSSWSVDNSSTLVYMLNIQNVSAACGTSAEVSATFTLEADGSDPTEVERMVTVQSEPCACTMSNDYWKANSGLNGAPDSVTAKLPIWLGTAGGTASLQITTAAQAREVFNAFGEAGNGINRLYRGLLSAKLNIANGTSDASVASVIGAADSFLAQHGSATWSGLSQAQKDQVNAWAEALADYNNGVTGPGACS